MENGKWQMENVKSEQAFQCAFMCRDYPKWKTKVIHLFKSTTPQEAKNIPRSWTKGKE